MSWKSLPKYSDYGLGPAYTTEFSLLGKNNVAEKVRVMENPGLFSKDFKVACKNLRYLGTLTHARCQDAVSLGARKQNQQKKE